MKREAERRAYICRHKEHGETPLRVFLDPGEPEICKDGHHMARQANLSYKRPDVTTPIGRSQTTTRRK
jgi:hypothetical protein